MDTLNYLVFNGKIDRVLNELSNLQVESSFWETYCTVIVALIVGLFTGFISLHIGSKQIKAITVNSIKLKAVDKCRELIVKIFQASEQAIFLVGSGNVDNDLFIKHYEIKEYLDELEIFINSNDKIHNSFIKLIRGELSKFVKDTNESKDVEELKTNWRIVKSRILKKFHTFVSYELRQM